MNRINFILLGICSLLITGIIGYNEYSKSNNLNFVIEMEVSTSGASQLFLDTADGYNEQDSIVWNVQPGGPQRYSIKLPALTPIKSIRFDPINITSVIRVKKAQIENELGETLRNFPIQTFRAIRQINRMDVSEDVLIIQTEENATDPIIEIENSSFERENSWGHFILKRGWMYAGYTLLILLIFIGLQKCRWQKITEGIYKNQNIFILIIISILISGVVGYKHFLEINKLYFVIEMEASTAGTSQIFIDTGNGYNEKESIAWHVRPGIIKKYSFPLPELKIKSLRFDPLNLASTIKIKKLGIENALSENYKNFLDKSLIPIQQINRLEVSEDVLLIHTTENANDPIIEIANSLVDRKISWKDFLAQWGWIYFGSAVVIFVIFMGLAMCRFPKIYATLSRLMDYAVKRPREAITFIGIVSVIASCYPVIFFGMSFVSPLGGAALYSGAPWIPGFPMDAVMENFRRSDVGAMLWEIAPNSVVQHVSVFGNFEFPFWNRYVGGGVPLFAQGQSMIGDVLHWIPIILNGSSIGWDVKFILAKAIFSSGMGLLVYRLTNHLTAGVLIAATSAFLGFAAFRFNHPALFCITYAPWVIIQWTRLGHALAVSENKSWFNIKQAMILAIVAWLQLNSGSPKEGVITALFIHVYGFALFYDITFGKYGRARSALLGCCIGLAIIMISAPYWLLFLDALGKSFSLSDSPKISTLDAWAIAGFFDNILFQIKWEELVAPSTNLFVLIGMSSAALGLITRKSFPSYCAWILFLLAMGVGYGYFPINTLTSIPLVNNIHHAWNVFSVPMMVFSLILAGYGICDYLNSDSRLKFKIIIFSLVVFGGLITWFRVGAGNTSKSGTFLAILSLVIFLALHLMLWRQAKRGLWTKRAVIGVLCCIGLLQVRHGMHLMTGIDFVDNYVSNPPARGDYSKPSEAMLFIGSTIASSDYPVRVIGERQMLFPGFSKRLGVESIVSGEPLRSKDYENLLDSVDYPDVGWGWLRLIESNQFASRSKGLDVLGIGYVVADAGTTFPKDMVLVYQGDMNVWQRKSVWPRGYFVNKVVSINKESDWDRILSDANHQPFAAVELEQSSLSKRGSSDRNFNSFFLSRRPIVNVDELVNDNSYEVVAGHDFVLTGNSTSFSVDAKGPGMIVLSETYYPGDFIAKLNGKEVDYVRVNIASKGIWIEQAGKYEVKFTYRPEKLLPSGIISLLGLFFLCLLTSINLVFTTKYQKII